MRPSRPKRWLRTTIFVLLSLFAGVAATLAAAWIPTRGTIPSAPLAVQLTAAQFTTPAAMRSKFGIQDRHLTCIEAYSHAWHETVSWTVFGTTLDPSDAVTDTDDRALNDFGF